MATYGTSQNQMTSSIQGETGESGSSIQYGSSGESGEISESKINKYY